MAGYLQGVVAVSTTPTKILTVPAENDGVLISASAAVVIGGSTVTATGATAGIPMTAGQTLTIPSLGGVTHDLWGVAASSTSNIAYLVPTG